MNPVRLEASISLGSVVVHVIVWVLICLVTLGIGAFFYPYAFGRVLLNDAYLLDGTGRRVGRLRCEANVANELGHIIVWIIISFVTCGIGGFFYMFKAFSVVLNNTRVMPM